MPFKIVETIENGKYLLSTVPSCWEKQGTLYWPQKHELKKLKKIESSVPENNWKTIPCILKRANIATYEQAEYDVAQMSDVTDTDQEIISETRFQNTTLDFNDLVQQCLSKKEIEEANTSAENIKLVMRNEKKTVPEGSTHLLENQPILMNLNDLTEKILEGNHDKYPSGAAATMPVSANVVYVTEELELGSSTGTKDEEVPINSNHAATTAEKIDFIITVTNACQENQKVLFENQQAILKKLALLDTKLEEYFTRTHKSEINNSTGFKIINSKQELDDLEKRLSNSQIAETLFKNLSVVCSKGKNRGHTNAYSLADVMFNRQFMTQCSWAGGTRREEPKLCFKAYTNTIALFFKIIHNSDEEFTRPDCENFFKNIMRHSLKRSEAKLLRASSQKRRSKKQASLEDVKKTSNNITENVLVTANNATSNNDNQQQLPLSNDDDEDKENT